MAPWALTLCLLYMTLVFGVRTLVQQRMSGSTGWVRRFGATAAERSANALFLAACALDLLGPVLAISGRLQASHGLENPAVRAAGLATFAFAIPAAMLAQQAMGTQWRTGIDPRSRSRLVTEGPFAVVRNPVYTTMLTTSVGTGLLVPTAVAIPAVLACLTALEIQTRLVEEPFLESIHGTRYREYSARVGRFLPSIGRRPAGISR